MLPLLEIPISVLELWSTLPSASREALLLASFVLIGFACVTASKRDREGLVGAAVRFLATLLIPAVVLAFVHALYWELSLCVSCALACLQFRRIGIAPRETLHWRLSSLPLMLAVALVSIKAAIALSSVPYDGDSMTYHLPMSIAFVQHHTAIPWQVMFHPGNAELLDALGLAALGSVGGQCLTEVVVAVVFFCAAFGFAEAMGANVSAALGAASAALAIPIVGDQLVTSENDILVAALLLATVALWRRFPSLSAVSLGLLAGTKFTGTLEAIGLVAVLWKCRSDRLSWKHAAIAICVGAPWYVRNFFETGNAFFLGKQTSGFASSIAAHLMIAVPYLFTMLRNYGGLLSIAGLVAMVLAAFDRQKADGIVRTVPLIVTVTLFLWVLTPNTAETSPGTLDELHSGWSIRYIIFVLTMFTVSVVVWISRRNELLGTFIACVAVISTAYRELGSVRHLDAGSLPYVVPILGVVVIVILAAGARSRVTAISAAAAGSLVFGIAAVNGSARIASIWNERYAGSLILGRSAYGSALTEPYVTRANKTASIGRIEALPLVGSRFQRFDLVDKSGLSDQAWWREIQEERPQAILASDERHSESMDPKEILVRASGTFTLRSSDAHVRVYTPVTDGPWIPKAAPRNSKNMPFRH